ncbi:DsrE family protein [Breoghania sp.]|uniref:DsrE family protein n=1 Tax=Breoghania sp. TaxID=2065378 RepID=UPI002AA70978|nr:DsrE family protein [Breoghania sp.]
MSRSKTTLVALALAAGLLMAPLAMSPMTAAFAGDSDPLFINLTSDDGHRINMALAFGGKQHKLGHKLTVFMNDKAVMAASKANSERFAAQQATIAGLLEAGATIIVCPMCMKHYGVNKEDLMEGLKPGAPEITGAALFEDNSRTLTW